MPLASGFHACGHALFSGNTMFWKVFSCWAAKVLHIDKVEEVMANLENDNYAHISNFHTIQVAVK